ncbi:hypothetical protein LOAG_04189 [Loa loa]|uniref:Splicing factor 3B subunit 6 n=1 Tax=Loa loa TaxID=7209 RepID=A0A1S0U361_LOALO|nr:hypothetical protein LOAG_04189 [Loa loa]EFO24292.1 hypothetical protein LOAG_04189 [Loa loa]
MRANAGCSCMISSWIVRSEMFLLSQFGRKPMGSDVGDKVGWPLEDLIQIMALANRGRNQKLPPEVNRILYVKNLPYKITSEEMYDIFGKFGAVRQIRVGNTAETRGTAFVVYEDIFDAKNACEHLSGFNVSNRYLVVLYYQATKAYRRMDTDKAKERLEEIKERYNLGGDLEKEKKDKLGYTPTPRR